jgi:hypothetical protein
VTVGSEKVKITTTKIVEIVGIWRGWMEVMEVIREGVAAQLF